MKRITLLSLCLCAGAMSGSAWAAKVSMPKEGGFELKFCTVGSGTTILANDHVYASHYAGSATLVATMPGAAFDRQTARCWGTLGIVAGKARHLGYCDIADMDGDKWLMEYVGKDDNSGGTYTAASGTGKYEGMTLKGEYKLDFWPGPSADGYAGCHHNKGTYRLK
jgi:hypothetical protein